jgi:hypothetical protein
VSPDLYLRHPQQFTLLEGSTVTMGEPLGSEIGPPETAEVFDVNFVPVNFEGRVQAADRGAFEADVCVDGSADHMPTLWQLDGAYSSMLLNVEMDHDSLLPFGFKGRLADLGSARG